MILQHIICFKGIKMTFQNAKTRVWYASLNIATKIAFLLAVTFTCEPT